MSVALLERRLVSKDVADVAVEDDSDAVAEEFYPVEYNVTSYGADYDVEGLVRRMKGGDIEVPDYQRGYVWGIFEASRFIESLLLGLPVPAIFLSRDENQKLLVIDGQQRLRTLQYFYEGVFKPTKSEFALRKIHKHYEGRTYATLDERDRRKLDNSIMHAIIVKQEGPPENAPSSVYHIFERLNTGGIKLKPQEIRSAVFHGKFSKLLETLNRNVDWRTVFGRPSKDMRDQELILRFFALLHNSDRYEKPMKEFLNGFMLNNRNLQKFPSSLLTLEFEKALSLIEQQLGRRVFKPKSAVNAALCDAILVGIARRLQKGEISRPTMIRDRYDDLLADEDFLSAINSATTDEENVKYRLMASTEAFGKVR